ncbi:NAD(P)/FAD-dependent oxidoreductase [Gemmatimonadota bacterium]
MLARTVLPQVGGIVNAAGDSLPPLGTPGRRVLEGRVWDVAVVGAGPAGAMAAYELARVGKAVLLLDRQTFPRWKVCGATLSPGAQHLLARVGLDGLLKAAGAQPLHTLRLGGWARQADISLNGSMALSRLSLDPALVQAAVNAGALFCPGARGKLGGLFREKRIVHLTFGKKSLEVSARVVVAADGLVSGLMAQAGLPSQPLPEGRRPLIGLGGVFPSSTSGFPPGVIHMAVGKEGYVGLVRVEDGSLNLAAALSPDVLKGGGSADSVVASLLEEGGWPALPGSPSGKWKGTPELTRRPHGVGAERLFAVGDAGGYVEPFTGEGMLWALAGAHALAPLAARATEGWEPGLLEAWGSVHRRLMVRAQRVCRLASWTLARPFISRTALGMLQRHPGLAAPLVRRAGSLIVSPA